MKTWDEIMRSFRYDVTVLVLRAGYELKRAGYDVEAK